MNKSELIETFRSLPNGVGIVIVTNYSNYMMVSEASMISETGYVNLSDYKNDSLELINSQENFNINEIWTVRMGFGFDDTVKLKTDDKTLLWKRNQVVELTMDEIAKKFGISIDQLKIRK